MTIIFMTKIHTCSELIFLEVKQTSLSSSSSSLLPLCTKRQNLTFLSQNFFLGDLNKAVFFFVCFCFTFSGDNYVRW